MSGWVGVRNWSKTGKIWPDYLFYWNKSQHRTAPSVKQIRHQHPHCVRSTIPAVNLSITMVQQCSTCERNITSTGGVACTKCKRVFHKQKQCSQLNSATVPRNWTCTVCLNENLHTPSQETSSKELNVFSSPTTTHENDLDTRALILSFQAEMRQAVSLLRSDFQGIRDEL